jgi:glutaredoxin-like YruB-family protein
MNEQGERLMKKPGASIDLLIGAFAVLAVTSGCDQVATLLADAISPTEAQPPAVTDPALTEVEAALPERPATSTARSETDVITFRSILDNKEMTQKERIRAFESLGPAALQKPIARSNVSGGPPTANARREPRQDAPSASELSTARRRVPVVMYSTTWCGVCERARKYFQQEGISFLEHDVDEDPAARDEYLRLNPRRSVPTIKVGDEVIVGFSAQAVNTALDSAARSRLN